MSDVVQSNFKRRIADGEVIFNPMTQETNIVSGSGIGPKVRWTYPDVNLGQTYRVDGNYPLLQILGKVPIDSLAGHMPLPGHDSVAATNAVIEASTKAQRLPTEANYLVTLAEFRQVMRLVPDVLGSWKRFLAAINRPPPVLRDRSHQTRELLRQVKAADRLLVNNWLIMRFGVRPLIMDSLNLLKVLKKAYQDEPVRLTQRGQAAKDIGWTVPVTGTYGVVVTSYTSTYTENIRVRAMRLVEVRLNALYDAGLSLASIPEAAIDLVRFSFVLNWVINLNDFFSSLGALSKPDLHDLGGCYVLSIEQSMVWQALSSVSTNPNYAIDRMTQGHVYVGRRVKRRINGLPPPKLAVRADPLKFTRDLRLLDAVALLRQNTRGANIGRLNELSKLSSPTYPF